MFFEPNIWTYTSERKDWNHRRNLSVCMMPIDIDSPVENEKYIMVKCVKGGADIIYSATIERERYMAMVNDLEDINWKQ